MTSVNSISVDNLIVDNQTLTALSDTSLNFVSNVGFNFNTDKLFIKHDGNTLINTNDASGLALEIQSNKAYGTFMKINNNSNVTQLRQDGTLFIVENGSEGIVFPSNYLAIGSGSNPSFPLYIENEIATALKIKNKTNTGDADVFIDLESDVSGEAGVSFTHSGSKKFSIQSGDYNDHGFSIRKETGTASDVLRVTNSNIVDVNGKMTIGSNYFTSYSGIPNNGLVIEGNVGIGKNSSINAPLDISYNLTGQAGLIIENSLSSGDADATIELKSKGTGESGLILNRSGGNEWFFHSGHATNNGLAMYSNLNTYEVLRATHNGKVGIFLDNKDPSNNLDVCGNVAIGKSYVSTHNAPNDGLIVEGSVGIGTHTPSSKLTIEHDTTDPIVLIKPVSTNGKDASIEIQGAQQDVSNVNQSSLIFSNYDHDTTSVNKLGTISGRVTDSTNNEGDLVFYNYSDGSTERETMRLNKDGNIFINYNSVEQVGGNIYSKSNNPLQINSELSCLYFKAKQDVEFFSNGTRYFKLDDSGSISIGANVTAGNYLLNLEKVTDDGNPETVKIKGNNIDGTFIDIMNVNDASYSSIYQKANDLIIKNQTATGNIYIDTNGSGVAINQLDICDNFIVDISGDTKIIGDLRLDNNKTGENNQGARLLFDDCYNVNGTNKISFDSNNKYGFGVDGSTMKYFTHTDHKWYYYGTSNVNGNGTLGMTLNNNNLTVENDIIAKNDIEAKQDANITNDLTVGNDISGNNDLKIGRNANVGNEAYITNKIGIGTTTPARNLDLTNTGQITFGDDVGDNNTSEQGIYWNGGSNYGIYRTSGNWTDPNYQQLLLKWQTGIILDPNAGHHNKSHVGVVGGMAIGTNYYTTTSKDSNWNNGMIIQGNVGIGTTSPSKELDVSGDISCSSELFVHGNKITFGNSETIDNLTSNKIKLTAYHVHAKAQYFSLGQDVSYGKVGFSVNDGKGNANIFFNHHGGKALEENGNRGRITVNTDSTTGASMDMQLLDGSGTGVDSRDTVSALKIEPTISTFAGDIKVKGNIIKSSSADAIELSSSNVEVKGHLTVTGNTIKSSTADAITLNSSDVDIEGDITVKGNTIKSSTADAIQLIGSDVEVKGDLMITGNHIRGNGGTDYNAIELGTDTSDVKFLGDITVGGNTIKSSTADAITLSSSDVDIEGDITVKGNTIKSSSNNAAIELNDTDVEVKGGLSIGQTHTTTSGQLLVNDSIGIGGLTSTNAKLDINTNDNYPGILIRNGLTDTLIGNNNSNTQIGFSAAGVPNYTHFIQTYHNTDASDNKMNFNIYSGGSGGGNGSISDTTHALTLTGEGYAGIGTSSPEAQLELSKIGGTTLSLVNPSDSYPEQNQSIEFKTIYATTGFIQQDGEDLKIGRTGTGSSAGIKFYTTAYNSSGNATGDRHHMAGRRFYGINTTPFIEQTYNSITDNCQMIIGSSGNVGIGTSSPDAKLDVSGNTYIRGDLTVDGSFNFISNKLYNVTVQNETVIKTNEQIDISNSVDAPALKVTQYGSSDISGVIAKFIDGDDTSKYVEFGNEGKNVIMGGLKINSTSSRTNILDISGDVYISSNTDISGHTTIDNSFNVTGNTHILGRTDISGHTTVDNSFNVTGNTDLSGDLTVTGNVGIGTTSPNGKLHISSGATGDCELILEADTTNNASTGDAYTPKILFRQDGAKDWSMIGADYSGDTADEGGYNANALTLANSVNAGGGIIFKTNNSDGGYTAAIERMKIAPSGNVGIGRTNPGAKLDVSGNIKCSGDVRLDLMKNHLSVGTLTIGRQDTSNYRNHSLTFYNSQDQSSNYMAFNLHAGGSSTSAPVERMRILGNGNVGIGTTSPNKKLEVVGDISCSADLYVHGLTTINNSLNVTGNVGIGTTSPMNRFEIIDDSKRAIKFGQGSSTTGIHHMDYYNAGSQADHAPAATKDASNNSGNPTTSNPFFINYYSQENIILCGQSGNVGIGTNDPDYKLDVNGNFRCVNDLYVTSSGGYLRMHHNSGGYIDYKGGDLYFRNNNGTTATTKMTLTSGGNLAVGTNTLLVDASNNRVGIGTTSPPSTELDVSGDIKCSGDLYVDGNEIRSNGGSVAIRLDNPNVEVRGDLTVTGNTIKSSSADAIELSGNNVEVKGNLNVNGHGAFFGGSFNTINSPPGVYLGVLNNNGKKYGHLQIVSNQSSGGWIDFTDNSNGSVSDYDGRIRYGTGGDFGGMTFYTNGNSERMRIDLSGNVGIGKTPGDYKLDVNGNINCSSITVASGGALSSSSVDIDGGAIDNTAIGGTTASTGAFTTLSTSSLLSANDGLTVANGKTLTSDTVDINGGAIDNTAIGGTTASTGAFTTLSTSSLLSANDGLTVANGKTLTSDTVDINGGAIDNTAIGGTTASSGAFTTLSTSSLLSANDGLTVANGKTLTSDTVDINGGAIDNTAIGSNSASTGAFTTLSTSSLLSANDGLTVANGKTLTSDTVDINGGAIDNTAIGGTTASTGAFTTITASKNNSTITSPTLLVKNVADTGEDSYVEIRGTMNGLATSSSNLTFTNDDADNQNLGYMGKISGRITNHTTNVGGLAFSTSIDGSSNNISERMFIDNSGNVGIGTSNPDAKLAVNGDFKVHTTNDDWLLVFRQTMKDDTGNLYNDALWNNADPKTTGRNPTDPTNPNYSILHLLDSYKNEDSVFHLKYVDVTNDITNEWKQDLNPFDEQDGNSPVQGYVGISIDPDGTDKWRGGLGLSTNTTGSHINTHLDGGKENTWWWAIGVRLNIFPNNVGGKIPAAGNDSDTGSNKVELYVKIPSFRVDNTGNTIVGNSLNVIGNTYLSDDLTVTGNVGIGTTSPSYILDISSTGAMRIPVGTTNERPTTSASGLIRYNNSNSTFEGCDGSNWGSLGGVMDIDQDTYITAEEASDDDTLRFYTAGNERMTIDVSGNVKMNNNILLLGDGSTGYSGLAMPANTSSSLHTGLLMPKSSDYPAIPEGTSLPSTNITIDIELNGSKGGTHASSGTSSGHVGYGGKVDCSFNVDLNNLPNEMIKGMLYVQLGNKDKNGIGGGGNSKQGGGSAANAGGGMSIIRFNNTSEIDPNDVLVIAGGAGGPSDGGNNRTAGHGGGLTGGHGGTGGNGGKGGTQISGGSDLGQQFKGADGGDQQGQWWSGGGGGGWYGGGRKRGGYGGGGGSSYTHPSLITNQVHNQGFNNDFGSAKITIKDSNGTPINTFDMIIYKDASTNNKWTIKVNNNNVLVDVNSNDYFGISLSNYSAIVYNPTTDKYIMGEYNYNVTSNSGSNLLISDSNLLSNDTNNDISINNVTSNNLVPKTYSSATTSNFVGYDNTDNKFKVGSAAAVIPTTGTSITPGTLVIGTLEANSNVSVGGNLTVTGNNITFGNTESIENTTNGTIDITAATTKLSGDLTVTGNNITFGNGESIKNTTNNTIDITADTTKLSGDLTVTGNNITFGNTESIKNTTNGTIDITATTTKLSGNLIVNDNVGIGRTTPGAKLDVSGNIKCSGDVRLDLMAGHERDGTLTIGRQDNSTFRNHSLTFYNSQDQSSNYMAFNLHDAASSTSAPVERMRILGNGNVGIGTTSPMNRFEMIDDSNRAIKFGQGIISGGIHHMDYYNAGSQAQGAPAATKVASNNGNPTTSNPFYINYYSQENIILCGASGNVGIGTGTPGQKLVVNGTTESASFNATSDRRKKENICVLENPLEKICQIRGVSFTFIDDKDEHKQKHAGIIAQEVDSIIPEVVCKKNDDLWTANYNSLIAYLIESVKTLKHENDDLKHNNTLLNQQLKEQSETIIQQGNDIKKIKEHLKLYN